MKGLLRITRRIGITNRTRLKIRTIHNQNLEEVFNSLRNPSNLIAVQRQPARRPHNSSYKSCFRKTRRKTLVAVITYKAIRKEIYIITAFTSTKQINKLIKVQKIKRR